MTGMGHIAKGLRNGLLAVSLLALSACTSFTSSNVAVSQTGDNPAPDVVPEGTDPEDEVIGRREHPRIIASYGGVYSDRQAEIMIARIVGRLLAAADQPNPQFTVTILDSCRGQRLRAAGRLHLCDARHPGAGLRHQRARGGAGARDRARDAAPCPGAHQPDAHHRDRRQVMTGRVRRRYRDRPGRQPLARCRSPPSASSRNSRPTTKASRSPARPATIRMRRRASSASWAGSPASRPATATQRRLPLLAPLDARPHPEGDRDGAHLVRRAGPRRSRPRRLHGRRSRASPSATARRRARSSAGASSIRRCKFTFTVPEGYTLQNSQSAVVGVAGDGEAVRFDSAEVPAQCGARATISSPAGSPGSRPTAVTSAERQRHRDGVRRRADRPVELPRLGDAPRWPGLPLHLRRQGRQRPLSRKARPGDARRASAPRRPPISAQIRKVVVRIVTAGRRHGRFAGPPDGRRSAAAPTCSTSSTTSIPAIRWSPGEKYKIVTVQ